MPGTDILITGTPRSGTTLVCHLLNKVDDCVALHEPMKVKDLAQLGGREQVPDAVQAFCDEQRASLLERGVAVSKNVQGEVPDNPASERPGETGLRKSRVRKGEIHVDRALTPDLRLVVKHNSAFTAVLGELAARFPVHAVMRNPLAVLNSWNAVDMPAQRGRAPAAERLDARLRDDLDAIADRTDRQLHLLSWFHERWHRHLGPDRFLRYEDVIESRGRALAAVAPGANELDEPLEVRNPLQASNRDEILRLGERLLASDGDHWRSYSRESVESLLAPAASSA